MRMTGWRIGWLAGDEAVMKAALVLHGYVVTCASSISQEGGVGRLGLTKQRLREKSIAQSFCGGANISLGFCEMIWVCAA
jgi:aspartate/methionine/tyrosine aminotransferase